MRTRVRLAVVTVAAVASACGGGSSPGAPSQPVCTAVATSALSLESGELFRVRFRVPPGLGRDIVLVTYLGLPQSGFSSSSTVHRLFDGATLLGTQNVGQDTVAMWKSPESSFGTPGDTVYGLSGPAVAVNFDAIANGTIDGRVELAVTSGRVTIESASQAAVLAIGPVGAGVLDIRMEILARERCRAG